jgi:homoserine O-succinyltransferase/O-acetyltransferase
MAVILSHLRRSRALLAREGRVLREPTPQRLRIGLLNLMPERALTELQFARLLSGTTHAIELVLMSMDGAHGNARDPEGDAGYLPWQAAVEQGLDGLIVTGAPVERLPFEQVRYWHAVAALMDEAAARALPTLYVCWSAQAALYHFHRIDKRPVDGKLFGIYRQRVQRPAHALTTGLGASFAVPVSRHTTHQATDLLAEPQLELLADHPLTGPALVDDPARGALYVFNHPEYDTAALDREYHRDLARGRPVALPVGYYADEPGAGIPNTWHSAARVLFHRWLRRVEETRAGADGSTAHPRGDRSILQPDNHRENRPWPLAAAS